MQLFKTRYNKCLYQILIKEKAISKRKIALALLVFLLGASSSTLADDFDGSQTLSGITGRVIEINRHKIIDNINPDTIGLPRKFQIDFKTRTLRPSRDSLVRKTITFKSVEHIENKLVMQGIDTGVEGVEDGLAWSLTLSRKTGKAVLSASGDGVAYVVFGVCMPFRDDQ